MKRISILGSTGSIGCNTLKVIEAHPEEFSVVALAANTNLQLLKEQVLAFSPEVVCVFQSDKAKEFREMCPQVQVLEGTEGLKTIASLPEADFVVSAIVGARGIEPTLAAIEHKKSVGLANKEVLVAAGELVMKKAKENGVSLIPIDSEHSAIFQCLNGEREKDVSRIILTASGGPFRKLSSKELQEVTLEDALKHPNWSMGKKVTIDSSTLMNKGLEFIEAYHLFAVELKQIEVVVHPQSLVHSMVEFVDHSIIAQMSKPCMTVPIQYALSYPKRLKAAVLEPFDFTRFGRLDFFSPDLNKFPCLRLAMEAIAEGGSFPCFLNAANETLVERFINKEISWVGISQKLERLLEKHNKIPLQDLLSISEVDNRARKEAHSI
ncbi:1-deoxy-D-xylulose 5-phosphate reductoisomerase [Chlamydiales bacterium SCGC AB-751-O23]|nr:1-deoxy-D-xylulose 5-phosphate reductoisomerase [Chlamydiales bacterium SCGC AB-751-O23]